MSIDAGTGSVRAVIFDELGNEIAIASQEWVHLSEDGVDGSMSFDYTKNWGYVKSCIKRAINISNINPRDIKAITSSSMREGIVLYDKDNNEIWAVANVDSRASKEVKFLNTTHSDLEDKFYKISGQTFALGAIPRLLWLKNNKQEIYEKVAKLSMISDWILFKLSGIIASEPSNAGTTGIFSLTKRDWDSSMLHQVGLRDDILPPIYESGEIIGEITSNMAMNFGFCNKTKIVTGGGDVQLGTIGLGLIKESQVAILGGSFWQQVVNIKSDITPPQDMSIRINPHVAYGYSQAEGITFFSGLVARWFRDALGGGRSFEELEELSSKIPVGSYGILPIFSDSMKYGKWYHASPSFINLSIDPNKSNIGSMFRSIQENSAIVSAINLQKIYNFAPIQNHEIIFSAGASKGKVWSKIVSDVTGKVVKVPKVKEATSLGGAMLSLKALGKFDSLQEAASLVEIETIYEPDLKNTQKYQEISHLWQEVYNNQLKLVDSNLTTSMWKAPGL